MPAEFSDPPYKRFLHPLYWPTWLGLAMLWSIQHLPYSWLLLLGRSLGLLGFYIMPGRRRITRTNIRLCFPALDKKAVRKMVRQNFQSSSIALLESGLAWWGSEERLYRLYQVEGQENLREAEAQGKGVLLLGGHYTTLEISCRFARHHIDKLQITYKPAHDPLFEAVMTRPRRKFTDGLIPSKDMRSIIRALRNKNTVWFAPDQDFGMVSSVFADFMGVPAATLTITARIAKASGAPVVPFYSERLPGSQGYLIRFGKALQNFPSSDDVEDAEQINQAIEQGVRYAPEQYLWGHRRFKTRPRGEAQIYTLRRAKHMRRYSQLLGLFAIPIVIYTLWTALRHRDKRYLLQRLGLSVPMLNKPLWFHAASVGEVNAIIPLIRKMHSKYPHKEILLTSNTPTGRLTARQQAGDIAHCYYLPLDWRWSSKRFLQSVRPACALITETELWPNLYEYCFINGIRIVIVNGRMSKRSVEAPFFVRKLLSQAVQYAYAILARSEEDARNFKLFSEQKEHIRYLGNIKYAGLQIVPVKKIDPGRAFVLAASTRDGEEKLLVQVWRKISQDKPLLLIVPRHPRRLQEILSQLKPLNNNIAVRSRNDAVTDTTEIYIADTIGELSGFIGKSEFVIMGGGFLPHGGQNILEVARAGKAVIFGQYMDNFRQEALEFITSHAGIQVNTEAELLGALEKLLSDHEYRRQLGENGKLLIHKYSTILDDYMLELGTLCQTDEDQAKPTHVP